jgi:hypothetical protein
MGHCSKLAARLMAESRACISEDHVEQTPPDRSWGSLFHDGPDHLEIQFLTGHVSIETTERYLDASSVFGENQYTESILWFSLSDLFEEMCNFPA